MQDLLSVLVPFLSENGPASVSDMMAFFKERKTVVHKNTLHKLLANAPKYRVWLWKLPTPTPMYELSERGGSSYWKLKTVAAKRGAKLGYTMAQSPHDPRDLLAMLWWEEAGHVVVRAGPARTSFDHSMAQAVHLMETVQGVASDGGPDSRTL